MRLGNHSHCRQVGGRSAALRSGLWSQFWSHSPPSGAIHRRSRPPVRAGHVRSRTVVNGGAQYSKACEGASLPWVQIPPPPPLTCINTGLGGQPAAASRSPGLIYWSQFRAACGATAGISRGCCAWSRAHWTVLNTSTHAAEACALPFTAGRDRPRPAGYLPTYGRITRSDRWTRPGRIAGARRHTARLAGYGKSPWCR